MRTKPFLFCFLYLYICKSKKNINFQVQIFTQGKAWDDKPFPTPPYIFLPSPFPSTKKKQLRDALRGGTRAITFDYKNNEKEKKKMPRETPNRAFELFTPEIQTLPPPSLLFFSPHFISVNLLLFSLKATPLSFFPHLFIPLKLSLRKVRKRRPKNSQ